MSMKTERISDAELSVMQALWQGKEPMNVTQLRQILQQQEGWGSSTVKTLVGRLCAKGAVAQEKREVYYYRALIEKEDYSRHAAESLVSRLYGGSVKNLVASLVQSGLSEEDAAELRGLLKGGEEP